jgi:hypothetical protein
MAAGVARKVHFAAIPGARGIGTLTNADSQLHLLYF